MKTKKPDIKVAESFQQTATLLGTTVAALKAARDAGCPGFKHSRFNLDEIRKWIADTPPLPPDDGTSELPSKATLERQRLRAQVRKIDSANEREAKLWVRVSEVMADITRIEHGQRAQLMTLLQITPTWSGLDPTEIEARTKAFIQEFCELSSDQTSKLYQPDTTKEKHTK